ncbi:MAG: DUF1501 domain-containing protein [Isosphaeraceae bacterium]
MKFDLVLSRRQWLRVACAGLAGGSSPGWLGQFARAAVSQKSPAKSVVLIWLAGGPSTIDLWDLKPGHPNGGPFREIDTASPGVRISEHLPRLATLARELAIVRSLSSREGDHGRATRFLQTGYLPGAGIEYPPVGSLISHELGEDAEDLPRFVSIASSRTLLEPAGGFLGPHFAPVAVGAEASTIEDLIVPNLNRPPHVSAAAHTERLHLLDLLERGFGGQNPGPAVEGMRSARSRALRMMDPSARAAFDLTNEPAQIRERYGSNVFGQGCLLARRLVERGVPFVEVSLAGWDTHNDNFERVRVLSGILDNGMSALLDDLRGRGLLESTLVVCQGEFGRTPRINGTAGRDHWPQSWAVALAGGGIRGGQVIGETSPDGMAVVKQPTSVPDLIATVCKAVGIDPRKQNLSNVGRPIRIADPAAQIIPGLL